MNLRIRELIIDNQKKDLVNAANGYLLPFSEKGSLRQDSQNTERRDLVNIKLDKEDASAVSLATSLHTDTNTAKGSSKVSDQQGIRAFLHNLLNSQNVFNQSEIVD